MKRAKKRPLPGPAKGASNRERRILRDYSQRRAGKAETMVALGYTDVHELYYRLADYGLRLPRVSDEQAREMVEGLERFLAEHGKRVGVARGKFKVPDSVDAHNDEVARIFLAGDPPPKDSAPTK